MQNKSKSSPEYKKWHRRVEGQIRDAINSHPEWFSFKTRGQEATMVNSLAKRIVGEIIADAKLADNLAGELAGHSEPWAS